MISQEFDYDEVLQSPSFVIKHYRDGSIYRGEIREDTWKRHGRGVIVYLSQRIYEGDWKNDKRNGRGYERFLNGNYYNGEYLNGRPHGKGVYTWQNNEVYDGEWNNGMKEGYGVWKGPDGDSYIGEWKQSKADGYGVHVWKNGKARFNWQVTNTKANGKHAYDTATVQICLKTVMFT